MIQYKQYITNVNKYAFYIYISYNTGTKKEKVEAKLLNYFPINMENISE